MLPVCLCHWMKFLTLKGLLWECLFTPWLFPLICVSVCPSHFVHSVCTSSPSQSPMSKLFRYSEPLGKSNAKKWSQIWTFLLKNGLKSPRQFFFFYNFFHFCTLFKRHFVPTFQSPMSKLFRFSESLGKSNGKNWSQIWKLLLRNGVKLPCAKKVVFFGKFCLTCRIFLLSVLLSASVKRFSVFQMVDFLAALSSSWSLVV